MYSNKTSQYRHSNCLLRFSPSKMIISIPLAFAFLILTNVVEIHGLSKTLRLSQETKFRRSQESNENIKTVQKYELWEPSLISETMDRWAEHYPRLLRVTTSQEAYGLPTAGGKDDCPFNKEVDGCLNYIITLQDFEAHPEGSESSNRLPEVLWSGELHGDEQVGPTAVLEATQLLLDAATCEAQPRLSLLPAEKGGVIEDKETYQREQERAWSCRQELYDFGIDDTHRQWLARLVSTRRIVIVPTANALGYYQKLREEANIDPNRDFPYDLTDPKACMNTIAGRTLNEVFREHMFQLSLTFHGGMEVIGYEWGAPSWEGYYSPDDIAQKKIASAYSQFAGKFGDTPVYEYGPMNDLVYAVRGGMEDWAYAGGFDPERVVQCNPVTYGGYPTEKTKYSDSTLRAFNMLVEASDYKIPPSDTLGTSLGIMNPDGQGNGHIARNIRLALLSAELVEPYVTITKVNGLALSDDIVPMSSRGGRSCQKTKAVSILDTTSQRATITWKVGGAFEVDEVTLWYAKWDTIPENKLDCLTQPSILSIMEYMTNVTVITEVEESSIFSAKAKAFQAAIDMSKFQPGDQIVVIASTKVDQSWIGRVANSKPDLPPQSHIVNVRTNPDWHHESAGKIIQGRLDWFSIPLTIVLEKEGEIQQDPVVELSKRFIYSESEITPESPQMQDATEEVQADDAFNPILMVMILAGCCVLCCCVGKAYLNHTMRVSQRERLREFIQDPNAISPGLKEKKVEDRDFTGNGKSYSDDRRYPDDNRGLEMSRYTVV